MSFRWYVARRAAWTLVALWLILSASFFFYAFTPNPDKDLLKWAASGMSPDEQEEFIEAYEVARDIDKPLHQRYMLWVGSFATFDFGRSVDGVPTRQMLAERVPRTLAYLIPAMVLSVLLGAAVGMYAALRRGTVLDRLITSFSYSGLAIPAFLLGEFMLLLVIQHLPNYPIRYDTEVGILTAHNLKVLAMPMAVVTVNLLVVQARYARAEALEYVPQDFIKTLKASGAGGRAVARHVLRNASIPLVSLFFTETLTVLFVTIYVIEYVFQVPGLGEMALSAIRQRDPSALLASVFLPVYIGLAGSFLQDVLYTYLDPRIDYAEL